MNQLTRQGRQEMWPQGTTLKNPASTIRNNSLRVYNGLHEWLPERVQADGTMHTVLDNIEGTFVAGDHLGQGTLSNTQCRNANRTDLVLLFELFA